MRKPIIAGNWKMNKTNSEAVQFIRELLPLLPADNNVEKVVCPPATALALAIEECKGTYLQVGAQNVHWEESGAFTGEVSPVMLKEMGVTYCIIGHSERRAMFGDTDDTVNKKAKAILAAGLRPIVCIGESLEQKEAGSTFKICESQVAKALEDIEPKEAEELVIAYEPIWAIGTGRSASSDDAQEVIAHIRKTLAQVLNNQAAAEIRIQYGGSVKPENIASFMEKEDIDGALVGGASLKAHSFGKLIEY